MKLCFIATQGGEFGGSEVLWFMTARDALLQGLQVLVSADHSYLKLIQIQELVQLGAKLHIRYDKFPKSLLNKILFKIRCYIPALNSFAAINKFEPDVIIVSQRGTYDAASQLMLYRFLIYIKAPFVLISQFHKENKADLLYDVKERAKKLFNAAHRYYFVSHRNKEAAEASINDKIKNAYIINNPIRLSAEELDWPDQAVWKVACVARINYAVKRQDVLVDVMGRKKWRSRNIQLNLFGVGPDYLELANKIKQKGIDNKVVLHGQVETIRGIWEQNHLFILPSAAEGLPLALVEANLFGRAAITTKVGDNERLVVPGKTGFLIHDLSEQAIDNSLEEAWEKRSDWKALGRNARSRALQNLDIDVHKTLLTHIQSIANE